MQWRGFNQGLKLASAGSLGQRLEKITTDTAELVPPERLQPPLREIERLRAEGIVGRALRVGDRAPEFELLDHNARTVRSRDLLGQGHLIISFFRGRWDPYCMTELAAWKEASPQVKAAGASLVAISPHTVKHTSLVFQQFVPAFPILSDAGNGVARQFGIVHALSEEMRAHMVRILINLKPYNGDAAWELPLPATYVVSPDDTIVFAFADEDPRHRAEPAEVITALAQLIAPPHRT